MWSRSTWSWSELGRAAQDIVDVVMVGARRSCSGHVASEVVVGARRSCSGHGRRGRGRSSAELLGTWSTKGKIPIFFPGVLPLVVSSPVSLSGGTGARLR